MNNCHQCYSMQRKSDLSHYFCFAKSAEPTRKCECFYPITAITAKKITIQRGDMNKRLQTAWARLNCQVIDRLGVSRHIIKNGTVICRGGYQTELNYLRINHPEVLNG